MTATMDFPCAPVPLIGHKPLTRPTDRPSPVAPIALFLYRRPHHTLRCLQSLATNPEFLGSPLYLFCDGPKDPVDAVAVEQVRRIVRELSHPHKVLVESPINRGLADSVIAGVTRVARVHGQVIVVEDDLVLAPTFLDFMNRSLRRYQDDTRVMQVSGHMYPLPATDRDDHGTGPPACDAVFLPLVTSWGWGTWERAWRHFDPEMRDFQRLCQAAVLRRQFDVGGSCPYFSILKRQRDGKADSWFIRWYLSVFMRGGLTLFPRHSLVRNEGFDGTGVHCGVGGSPYDSPEAMPHLRLARPPVLPAISQADLRVLAQVQALLASRNTFWQRARRRLLALMPVLSAPRPS